MNNDLDVSAKKQGITEEPPKSELQIIKEFDWIEFENPTQELDCIKTSQENHKFDKLDLQPLNTETLDLQCDPSNAFRGNSIDKIMKSIAKDGVIKTAKKVQDDYDLNDRFVDDTADLNQKVANLNQLTPAFDDFICLLEI